MPGRRERCARLFPLLVLAALLASCGEALTPQSFTGTEPRLEPERFFAGRTRSWGVFEDRNGDPQRRFTTAAIGALEGDTLILTQDLAFEDGRRQRRVWRLRRLDAHRYEATADDVVGVARGEAYGNAFLWTYTLAIDPGNPVKNVELKHWMYLQEGGGVLLNRVTISKLGFTIGEITEFIRRVPADISAPVKR